MRSRLLVFIAILLIFNKITGQKLYWSGDESHFLVSNHVLTLNAPAVSGTSYLSCNSVFAIGCQWAFKIELGFNPSSTNLLNIYLVSSSSNLSGPLNGYFVQIGNTNDEIALYRQDGAVKTKLGAGPVKFVDMDPVVADIKVVCDDKGLWTVSAARSSDGALIKQFEIKDNYYTQSVAMGVACVYTSTRSTKFKITVEPPSLLQNAAEKPLKVDSVRTKNGYCTVIYCTKKMALQTGRVVRNGEQAQTLSLSPDSLQLIASFAKKAIINAPNVVTLSAFCDAKGATLRDTMLNSLYTPFEVLSASAKSANTIGVVFSAEPKLQGAVACFGIGGNSAVNLTGGSAKTIEIAVKNSLLPGKKVPLDIHNLLSLDGDTIVPFHTEVMWYVAKVSDLRITEIMFDPSPVVLLPDKEYLEIYNTSPVPLLLNGYTLHTGSKQVPIPDGTVQPKSYALLAATTARQLFQTVANFVGLTTFPALLNDGDTLWISDNTGQVADAVAYTPGMWPTTVKSDGGWSVERIDVNLRLNRGNWAYSKSVNGGTPGLPNSLNELPDTMGVHAMPTLALSSAGVCVEFADRVDSLVLSVVKQNKTMVLLAEPANVLGSVWQAPVPLAMMPDTLTPVNISVNKIYWADGVVTGPASDSLLQSAVIQKGMVVINEVLFEPKSGCPEFVELYNPTDKAFDLADLRLALTDSPDALPKTQYALVAGSTQIMPGETVALTADTAALHRNYQCGRLLKMALFPSLSASGVYMWLLNRSAGKIDGVWFSAKSHLPFIANTKGISLERLSALESGLVASNWRSAAQTAGGATPGLPNSQAAASAEEILQLTVQPKIITPDNDGHNDVATVFVPQSAHGAAKVSAAVHDANGRLVKRLTGETLAGTNTPLFWDGSDETGARVMPGWYVVIVNCTYADNVTQTLRCAVAVSATY